MIPNFAEKNILILVEEKNFALCATKKKKYSNSCVVRKKDSERKKKTHNPPCKLNGRSLTISVIPLM
jgi:hypothetical protein